MGLRNMGNFMRNDSFISIHSISFMVVKSKCLQPMNKELAFSKLTNWTNTKGKKTQP